MTHHDDPHWRIDGRSLDRFHFIVDDKEIARIVRDPSGDDIGMSWLILVHDPRGAHLDCGNAPSAEVGFAVVEDWWHKLSRQRANDNRDSVAAAADRSVPLIEHDPHIAERLTHVWLETVDLDTGAVLDRALEGQGPAANSNHAGAAWLAVVAGRDVEDAQAEDHSQGRKR